MCNCENVKLRYFHGKKKTDRHIIVVAKDRNLGNYPIIGIQRGKCGIIKGNVCVRVCEHARIHVCLRQGVSVYLCVCLYKHACVIHYISAGFLKHLE